MEVLCGSLTNSLTSQKLYIVKIYFAVEQAARTRILVEDAGILLQSWRVGFRSDAPDAIAPRGRLC
jgi:hypothetical protein